MKVGAGGGLRGMDATGEYPGLGGTQTQGGQGGYYDSVEDDGYEGYQGSFGYGGATGGGGGYYGGGSRGREVTLYEGRWRDCDEEILDWYYYRLTSMRRYDCYVYDYTSGGGGSSYIGGVTSAYTLPGVQEGNGAIVIRYDHKYNTNTGYYSEANERQTYD